MIAKFDRLARLAARLVRAPVALVACAEGGAFFRGAYGLQDAPSLRREAPRVRSLCQQVMATRATVAVVRRSTSPCN